MKRFGGMIMVVSAEAIPAALHDHRGAAARAIMRYFAARRFLTCCLALLLLAGPFGSAAFQPLLILGGSAPVMTAQDGDPAKILRPQHLWDSLLRPSRAEAKHTSAGDADPPWIIGDRATLSHHPRPATRLRPGPALGRFLPRAHPGRPRAPPLV